MRWFGPFYPVVLGLGVFLNSATPVSAVFLDDFNADTSANYALEDSFGTGGSFAIADGTLNIMTGANNTASVTLATAQSLAVGESLGVDVGPVQAPNGVFMTLGADVGQPSGANNGYRWRRDASGGGNSIRIQRNDAGVIIGPVPDPDITKPATLWIDRVAADTFEFLIQQEGSLTRTSYGTDTYSALGSLDDLYIGVQAYDASANTFAFDNLRIVDTGSIGDINIKAVIDRDSGAISLLGDPNSAVTILGYTLTSARGSLNQSGWTTIAGNYDGQGNTSVDADDWSVLAPTGSHTLLAEAELDFDGGDGATIAAGQTVNLSQSGGLWIQNPVEEDDLEFTLLFDNGNSEVVDVEFVGNSGEAFKPGDLNFDTHVNVHDWNIFIANHLVDLSSLTVAQAYQLGDLDGDLDNDISDFGMFKLAYDADQGPGAFAAMISQVPEPSTALLMGTAACLTCGPLLLRRRWKSNQTS